MRVSTPEVAVKPFTVVLNAQQEVSDLGLWMKSITAYAQPGICVKEIRCSRMRYWAFKTLWPFSNTTTVQQVYWNCQTCTPNWHRPE